MRSSPLLLLFVFPLLLISPAIGEGDGRISDRSALLAFKRTVVDPDGLLRSWSGDDHCLWFGVSCDGGGRVVGINVSEAAGSCRGLDAVGRSGMFRRRCAVSGRRLGGEISGEIGKISELRVLVLPFQGLGGEIPAEIWGLEKLEVVDLEGNELSGGFPSCQFPRRLRVLNLAFNLIAGELPRSLSRCLNLEMIDLSGNKLNGTVPGFIGSLYKLRELYLSVNSFGGSIPDEIGNGCWSLEHLDLSGNLLLGRIPSSLGNCSRLQNLLLFSNLLDGFVPPELGRLAKLQVLDLSRNNLSGFVPRALGSCLELSVLVLSNLYNPLAGQGSFNYTSSDEFNYFQGGLPESITALPKLRVLWAPRAMFEGDIPSNWGTCKRLEMVNLGQNLLTGKIPSTFDGCQNIRFLNLSSNKLTGRLSAGLPVPCMDVFDVSNNQIFGSIPWFLTDQCSFSNFSENDLSSAYISFFAYKTRSGVPFPFVKAGKLFTIYHDFGKNNFTGILQPLPVATEKYGNQTNYAFLADGNNLVGSFNAIILQKCTKLNGMIINLRDNRISGEIASEIGDSCRSVVILDLAQNSISGLIPSNLGLLHGLVKLDLSNNFLKGQIPGSFEQLKSLKYLSLASNNLSGKIPFGLDQLQALEVLDLSSNYLTGEIPRDLMSINSLTVLLLNNNKLSGSIPSISRVTSLSMFNVSFNNLSGSLPLNSRLVTCSSVLGNSLLKSCSMASFSFRRASLLADSQNPAADTSSNSGGSGFSSIEIASIASASSIVAVLLALIVLYIYTRKCARRSSVQSSERKEVTVVVDIGVPLTYEIVVQATRGFNGSNCIGSGGFGATYKAEISPGVLVAIKRLAVGRFQGVQQFQAEIKTIGRWRHPNLVTLIGYHISDSEMFLIYNYLPGGNLERFIQERHKRIVDWRMLHKIALDVARALAYLHDQNPRILHRDVKPSNILLDNDYNAYLSDFGLARLLGTSETHATTGVAGTYGYVAPEYAMTCRVSDKADVYSYGVVLLELISDKKALDPSFSPYGNGFNIVTWASMLLQKGRAHEFFADGLWNVAPHDDLVDTLHLGIKCTVDSLSIRPTMNEVVRRLKELQPPAC